MEALEALKSRRSVRQYADRQVEPELIKEIVDCGRLAATAINYQPWEFVVVTDEQKRQALAAFADHGKFIAQAPVCIVVFCDGQKKYFLEDSSAATQNILVAAAALGLGSCWVAGHKKAYAEQVAQLLNVPKNVSLVALISIGYPLKRGQMPPKRSLDEVLHWESFKG